MVIARSVPLLGYPESGKTSLIKTILYDQFSLLYHATFIYDSYDVNFYLEDNDDNLKITFYDFSGYDIYYPFIDKIINRADAGIIAADIFNPKAVANVSFWIDFLKRKGVSSEKIIILLTKIDFNRWNESYFKKYQEYFKNFGFMGKIFPVNSHERKGLIEFTNYLLEILK